VIEEPEADQEPIQAPPPDIQQRQVRYREQHVGRGLLRRVVFLPVRQEEAAAAAAPNQQSESESEEEAAAAAAPNQQSESESEEETAAAAAPHQQQGSESEEDEIQLCHESSSTDDSSSEESKDEDRRHFERELEANPALRRAYERSETARRERGRFNTRPGHLYTRRNTRGREQRNPTN
jgi:hypothetical protein